MAFLGALATPAGENGRGPAAPAGIPLDRNAAAIWAALSEDTHCSVSVADQDGRYIWCNEPTAALLGKPRAQIAGHLPREFLVPELAQFVESSVLRVIETGEPLFVDGVLDAKYLRGVFRPLRGPDGALRRVLIVATTPGAATWTPEGPAPGVVRAPVPMSDPLARLSPRELEVLALLGRGMSVPEAARHLHRSVRTVEAHRYAIGRKLKIRNQAELAKAARLAGLAGPDTPSTGHSPAHPAPATHR
jgi:DNA-binding CsgD family transcriptional regulator